MKQSQASYLCKLLFLTVNTTIIISLMNLTPTGTRLKLVQATRDTIQPQQEKHSKSPQETTTTITTPQAAAASIPPLEHSSNSALSYLQRYGYMQAPVGASNHNHLISEESFSSAIADFQQFAGLPATGQVDNQTLALMRLPRCGNTDKQTPPTTTTTLTTTHTQQQQHQVRKLGSLSRARRRLVKRYALQGSKWRRQELTYRISQYPSKFSLANRRHEVDEQIRRAFGIWSAVAPIDFVARKEGRVHIDIRFASGDHGDGDAFDGPGNTLAHAYFPQYGGDAHFDDQEYWTVDSYAGTNIFQVAAHELGHSLGLGHSNVREALMAPFYQKYKPNFKLHLDDVLAIQALYGEKALLAPPPPTSTELPTAPTSTVSPVAQTSTTTQAPQPPKPFAGRFHPPIYKGKRRPPFGRGDNKPDDDVTTTTSPTTTTTEQAEHENGSLPELPTNGLGDGTSTTGSSVPDLCADSALDAITRTEDGSTYAFKGDHYWLLTNEGLARGYPRAISADWDGLPGQLDAALTWADGKTFFFKGNKYWRFRNKRRDLGYPKLISAGFAGVPDDIDAAFVWSGNGRTYFFKGTEYWRFDSKADPPVSGEYPRPIKVWLGVPAYINAAFKWENNVTYFFKGSQYYRFNDREFKVESRGRPAFPRATSEWWFGCVNSNLAQRAAAAPAQRRNYHLQDVRASQLQQQGSAPVQWPTSGHRDGLEEWALLASQERPPDQTAGVMGTHISDHIQPAVPNRPQGEEESGVSGSTSDSTGQVHSSRGEPLDAAFEASLNRRLAPPLPPSQMTPQLEQAFRPYEGAAISSASYPPSALASSSATSAIFVLGPSSSLSHLISSTVYLCTLIACVLVVSSSCRTLDCGERLASAVAQSSHCCKRSRKHLNSARARVNCAARPLALRVT